MKLNRLKEELKIKQRQRELNEWAVRDYGYRVPAINSLSSPKSKRRLLFNATCNPESVEQIPIFNMIESETDFIFKVRNNWIH